MITRSGITFDSYETFGPEHVSLNDITNHLSMLQRWCGATSEPWSVLDHSIMCGRVAAGICGWEHPVVLYSLLHDAHEAYTGDIPGPLKEYCPKVREIQGRMDYAIRKSLNIPEPSPLSLARVSSIDRACTVWEGATLTTHPVFARQVKDGDDRILRHIMGSLDTVLPNPFFKNDPLLFLRWVRRMIETINQTEET